MTISAGQCEANPKDAANYIASLALENAKMRRALKGAKAKLEAYYKASRAEYPGGPLYGDLMKQINDALGETDAQPSRD
jgi:hypothetical protein